MNRNLLALLFVAAFSLGSFAQNKLVLPEIEGFYILKGEMHIHSRFSDGNVWPTSRIDEAYLEGLDVLCVTDHIDARHKHMVKAGLFNCDRNESYRIASRHAEKYGMIVIPGGEITRGMPPGHFNTLFVKDVEPIAALNDAEKDSFKGMKAGLTAAKAQGSFNVWNHPHWFPQAPNETIWYPEHDTLYEMGLMNGIEIYNLADGYSPDAHRWAIERNLTLIGGTDSHNPMAMDVNFNAGEIRPCTLIFAKERSLEGVKDALMERRTAVYADGMIYGSEELLYLLAKSAIAVTDVKENGKYSFVTITNRTNIPLVLKKAPGGESLQYSKFKIICPSETVVYTVGGLKRSDASAENVMESLSFYIDNFHIAPDTPLLYKVEIDAL